MATSKRSIPEVQLKYSEFLWALGKLKYKDYGKKMQERDWFQINPLEVLLLGCKTLSRGDSAKRDQGTLLLIMEDLTPHMQHKPRFWLHLLSILVRTIKGKEVPSAMKNRCCSALCDLWELVQCEPNHSFRYGITCQSWFVNEFYDEIDEVLHSSDVAKGDARFEFEKLVLVLSTARESATKHISERVSLLPSSDLRTPSTPNQQPHTFGSIILGSCVLEMGKDGLAPHLVHKIFLSDSLLSDTPLNALLPTEGDSECSVHCLVSTLLKTSTDPAGTICLLLDLLTVAVSRLSAECQDPLEHLIDVVARSPTPVETDASHASSPAAEEETDHPSTPVTPYDPVKMFGFLLQHLTSAIEKWFGLCGEQKNDFGSGSLELAVVALSREDFTAALHECVVFFQEPVSSLMQYAHEGYLSSKPAELLKALLQFACTVVESGAAPSDVLTYHLPNLFGPVFGVRNHAVSLQLLQYGEMAINSRHRSTLLGAGLHQIMKVYGLCQPLEIKFAVQKALLHQCEAVDAAVHATRTLLSQVQKMLFPDINDDAEEQSGMLTYSPTYQLFSKPDELEVSLQEKGRESDEREFDSNESGVPLVMVEPTEAEIEEDRHLRHKILLGLFQLACAMVKCGDDINFIFRSELPKLLSQSPLQVAPQYEEDYDVQRFLPLNAPKVKNALPWKGDRRMFVLKLLHLTIGATESGVASPFKLLGIVVPKLAHNLDRLGFSDSDKLTVATDIFRMTSEAVDRGGNIEELISSGLDLISSLIPHGSSVEELKSFMERMLEQLVHSSHASILFLIRHSVQVFMKHAPEEERETAMNVFRKLIFKGRRNEIRSVYRVAQEELFHPRYTALRGVLYSYAAEEGLTGKQMLAVTEVLIPILSLDKGPTKSAVLQGAEEEDPEEIERRAQEEEYRKETVVKLLEPCLNQLEKGLTDKFSKEVCETVSRRVSLVALFRTLFWEDIPSLHSLSLQAIEDFFRSKMPPDLLDDSDMMQLLSIAATRLEHMQLPRYKSLKTQLVKVVEHLVASTVQEGVTSENAMSERSDRLGQYVMDLPWNRSSYPRLIECGYKESLWTDRISCTVVTDGSLSLQENLRQSLIACFQQYTDILQQMRITHEVWQALPSFVTLDTAHAQKTLTVDGEVVEVQRLFSDELTLSELKGRRALAVKTIDQHLGAAKEGHFQEKKIALLMKEDELESSSEKQAEQPRRPQQFTCTLNISFLDCMKCCGGQIIGCYAPNGEHCERPMEIGVRCDSAFISIYDASGTEVENAELLFCEEGVYVFKSYSAGHPYDTAKVWVTMFARLLKDPLIPAIVVPEGYPNESTWRLLRQSVPTEVTGSILTCQHDISAEWRTYYDYRPERIRCGQDIVLYPQFALTSEGSALPQLLQRQKSRLNKDLAGMMFDHVMQELLTDARMQSFRFMGKLVSMYIARLVQSGQKDASLIQEGFNHKKWKKSIGASSDLVSCSKEDIVQHIQVFVDSHLEEWLQEVEPEEFLSEYPKQAIELKTYLEQVPNRTKIQRKKLSDLKALILEKTVIVMVQDLPEVFQVELMHWVFNNEDRVWRYRGGRDHCETLQQYMRFLGQELQQSNESSSAAPQGSTAPNTYPGVVAFFLSGQALEGSSQLQQDHTFTVRDVIGYAVGETISGRNAEGGRRAASREGQKVLAVEEGSLVATPVEEVTDRHGNKREVVRYQSRESCYEVVTAWVHPNFRQLGLGVRMYFDIAAQVPAHFVMCDMLKGSVERIVQSSFLLRLIDRLRLLALIVVHKDISYAVDTQVGRTEQFERIVFRVWPVRVALSAHFFFCQCGRLWNALSSIITPYGSN